MSYRRIGYVLYRISARAILPMEKLTLPAHILLLDAIFASRKYLPLKLRTFVDHVIERTRKTPPWGTSATA